MHFHRKSGLVVLFVLLWTVWSCVEEPKTTPPTTKTNVVSSSPLIAMTPTEYNNTIRDLFGMPFARAKWPAIGLKQDANKKGKALVLWPWLFPKEAGLEKFEGMAKGQSTSPFKVEQLQKSASYFSNLALLSTRFFTCKDWKALSKDQQQSCAWTSLERFAQRAWRRPATKAELTRLKSFFESNWKSVSPEDAVKVTVAGILQTPAFLYRLEQGNKAAQKGDGVPLTSWEMASRLSYFLWDSMPDSTLFAAAAADKLKTKEQIAEQARRMLKDPRARQAVVHFHNQLLGTHNLHTKNPSREQYGEVFGFTPRATGPKTENDQLWGGKIVAVRESMRVEVELFVERTIFDGAGTFSALMTDNHGYTSTHTMPIYGKGTRTLSGKTVTTTGTRRDLGQFGFTSAVTLSPAEFPKDQRAGMLTLPGVLALYSHPVHPSPIHRGKFILERMACQSTGQPPPAAFGQEPPDSSKADGTNRERMEKLTSPSTCIGCHSTLNPAGFVFENYDSIGKWRDKDNGRAVNAKVTLQLDGGETFNVNNAIEFVRQMSKSRQIRNCYTLRWLRYATGIQVKAKDAGVKELQERFLKNDNVQELLVSIVSSDLFRYRRAGGAK